MNNITDILRIDKNIANNIDVLTEYTDRGGLLTNEDKNLIKNLIYYICFTRKNDIFGFGYIDPYEFAAQFGYANTNMFWKKHPNPMQLQGMSEQEVQSLHLKEKENISNRVYDSILENALFWLHTNVLRFKRSAKDIITEDGKVSYVESKSYILLPELNTTVIRKGRNKKYLYRFTVDKNFVNNLSLFYLNCNIKSLIALRKSCLDDLYLYLSNVRAVFVEELRAKKIKTYYGGVNYETLCDLAQIKKFTAGDILPKEIPNKKRKQLLINDLKIINERTELKFTLTWQKRKPTDKWDYQPVFDFHIKSDECVLHNDQANILEEKRSIFRENLAHELLEVYRFRTQTPDDEANFLTWIRDPSKDLKEKDMAYRNANFKTYGKIYPYIDRAIDTWLRKLPAVDKVENIV